MARRKRRKRKNSLPRADQSHRKAPMPAWFHDAPWGTCRWCNKFITKEDGELNTRRRWHPECLHDYLIITRSNYAKRQVKKRDKAICASCKIKCRLRSEWNCDHIKPLIDANGDIEFWKLGNMQTLCVKCHAEKTLQENILRGSGWFSRHKKKS